MNAEVKAIENRTMKGLIRAVFPVRRSMDTTTPAVPIDTGNLRASWFVVTSQKGVEAGGSPTWHTTNREGKSVDTSNLATSHAQALSEYKAEAEAHSEPLVIMGFSANYAAKVHEMEGANFRPRKKGGPQPGAKFLQAAIRESEDEILRVIRKEAEIKK